MRDFSNDIQQIEKFLEGKMRDDEKKEFENKLNQDQSLSTMMTDLNLLVEGIKISAAQTSKEEKLERLKFFTEINDIEESEPEIAATKVVPMYRQPWAMSAAASVILVVGLTFYFIREQKPLNQELYAAYFQPFDSPGSGLTRGGHDKGSLKTDAYEAYDNGNYKLASQMFQQVIREKEDPIAQLCLGNSYMAQNDLANAEKTFTNMLNNHSDLVTQVKWYLALTYLKENKMERAKAILWELSNSSTYGEKARKLLKQLD